MRLADFIESAQDSIVNEAIEFARSITVLTDSEESVLRNHIPQMLENIVADLRTAQSGTASLAKSRGTAAAAHHYSEADGHGKQRAQAGLNIDQLLAEYRSLRASVLRLWAEACPPDKDAIRDMTRFNEAIDQAIAESVRTYASETDGRRQFFLAALGHDLRGPLSAATLTAAAISNLVPGGPPQFAGFSRILSRSLTRMSRLLESLLDYNLVGLGRRMTLHLSRVDLQPPFAEEVEILRAALPQARIELTMAGDCQGDFDESRIREALSNLVSNAARHGVVTEPVYVSLQGTDKGIELTVSNTVHQPIAAAELALLFEPLRRGSASKQTAERTHLGLGLFITQEIAKAHGGEIIAACSGQTISFKLIAPRGASRR